MFALLAEFEIDLMDQSCRLQSVTRAFTSEIPMRLPAQFVIDEIQHGGVRFRISSASPLFQLLSYVVG